MPSATALLAVAFYPLLLVTGAFAQTGASFSNQAVTTQAPPSTGCVTPTAATSFVTTQNTVYLYFQATISSSDALTNNWLAPDGTVVPGVNWDTNSGSFCFPGASLSIGALPASQLGAWKARVYDNGNLLFSISFTVSGFSNQVVTAQAPPSTGCVRPTAGTSFPTTDGAVYLYFEGTIATSDALTSNWLAPDGTVVPGIGWASNSGSFCFPGDSLSIGSLPTSQIGAWQARVYDNGQLSFSAPFTVTGATTTGPAITVTNDASFATEISPGSLVALFGNGNMLATTTVSGLNPPLPTSVSGTSVTMNGILCPLIYVSPSQINLQAPMELQPGTATVVVSNNGQTFSTTVQVLTATPGIFTSDYYANGGLAILQDSSTYAALTANNPATPGENVTMYFTGIGPVTNYPGDGNAAPGSPALAQATSAASLTVNGTAVQPSYTGLIPGLVGYGQLNFQLPANTAPGSVPVVLTIAGVSGKTVYISVNAAAAPLVSIALSPSNSTIQPGATLQLTATGTYGNGSTQNLTSVVNWISSNTAVATVSASGLVTGVSAGGATVTAASGSISGTTGLAVAMGTQSGTTIYQTGFEAPTFSPGTINGQDSWYVFAAPSLTAIETATVKTGTQAVEVTPSGATSFVVGPGRGVSYGVANQTLTFSIDASFATIGSPSFWTVLDTYYNSSSSNIDVNIDQSGQIHIFITGTDHPTGVSITRGVWNHYELDVNFINDTVSAFYNGAPILQGAPFSSTGTTLGSFAFYAQGASSLAGTDSAYFDNLSVTASAAPTATLKSIAVTPAGSTIAPGATLQLTATGTYSDGSTQNLTSAVTWSSSNPGVATVNGGGLATGVAAGSSTVTAASGTVSGTTGLTVQPTTLGPAITSLSSSTPSPMSFLTIAGSGFTSDATVEFGPVAVLPVTISPTSIMVVVPPLLTGAVTVMVQESSGATKSLPIQVGLLPTTPLAPGTVTLGFLEGTATALTTTISGSNGLAAAVQSDLSNELASINQMVALITPVVNGTAVSATLGTANGAPLVVSAADLGNSDRLLLGLLQSIANLPASASSDGAEARPDLGTQPTIQQAAAGLYLMGTSSGTTPSQLSSAAATLITQSGVVVDSNFRNNLLLVAGGALGVVAVVGAVAYFPVATAAWAALDLAVFMSPNAMVLVTAGTLTLQEINGSAGPAITSTYDAVSSAGAVVAELIVPKVGGAVWDALATNLDGLWDQLKTICTPYCFNPPPPAGWPVAIPTINPPPTAPGVLTSLTLAPLGSAGPGSPTLTDPGGTPVTGILTFSGPVQTGGVVVTLTSDNSAAQYGAFIILVSGGQSSLTFTINTSAVTVQTIVHLSAAAGGVMESATLTLTPPGSETWTGSMTGTAYFELASDSGGPPDNGGDPNSGSWTFSYQIVLTCPSSVVSALSSDGGTNCKAIVSGSETVASQYMYGTYYKLLPSSTSNLLLGATISQDSDATQGLIAFSSGSSEFINCTQDLFGDPPACTGSIGSLVPTSVSAATIRGTVGTIGSGVTGTFTLTKQ